jgi:hypothetical protein
MSADIVYKSLSDMSRVNASQSGGYVKIQFIPVQFVTAIGDYSSTDGTIKSYTLVGGKSFYELKVPFSKRSFSEVQKDATAGPYFEISAEAYSPFETIPNHVLRNQLKHYRFIVLITMPSGVKRLMGSIANGAKLTTSYNTGGDFRGIPGAMLTFSWLNEDICPIYNPS